MCPPVTAPSTLTGTWTAWPFLSVRVMVQEPSPTGVTVKVATYWELPAGLVAGTLVGATVGQPVLELCAGVVPTSGTRAVSVAGVPGGRVKLSWVGAAVSVVAAPPPGLSRGAVRSGS